MNSSCFKDHDNGNSLNRVGSLSSSSGHWWSGVVIQSTYEDSADRLKPSFMEQLTHIAPKPSPCASDIAATKGYMTHFNIMPGLSDSSECKSSSNVRKSVQFQTAFSKQASSPQGYGGHLELGFGQQTVICDKYPLGNQQYYGVLSAYGPQIKGRVMLPLNLTTDDGPTFVNAKQYHGILRRRRSRAKAEMTKKVSKSRKPYLHLSRHLHAKRRPRGCGGRFLNTKEMEEGKDSKTENHPTDSQRSEVLQSDHGNSISPNAANGNGSHLSGSEVTSIFSMTDLNHFPIGNLSNVSLSGMMMSGNGMYGFGMHNKWVTTAAENSSHYNLAL